MRRIFYLTCALVAYGSLYPFQFVARSSPLGVLDLFAASLHIRLDRGSIHDILVNLLVYIPVGFFYVLDEHNHRPAWRRCLNATLAGALLSLSMETCQYWVETRNPSLFDLLNNTISAAAGGILGVAFARRARAAFDSVSETVLGHPSSALFLGILWAAALFAPGDWGRTGALAQIRAILTAPHLGPGHVMVSFSQWLGVGALAAAVVGRNRAPAVLFAACLAIPLRFLIPGQHPELNELVGVAAALCIWSLPAVQKRLNMATIALLLVLGLCVEELRPWTFSSHAGSFQWIPLISMLDSPDWAPTLLVLFRKVAFYGTTVWAIARAGAGALGAFVFTGLLLSVLELAQVFLPGRTAETTDPILAVIVGVIVLHFDRKFGADSGVGAVLARTETPAAPAFGGHTPVRPKSKPEMVPPVAKPRSATSGIWTGGRRPGV